MMSPRALKIAVLAAEKDPDFWAWAETWSEKQQAHPGPGQPMPAPATGRLHLGPLSTDRHPA